MPAGKHKQVTCGHCGREMRSDKMKVHAAKCKEKKGIAHEEEQSAEQSAVGTKKGRSPGSTPTRTKRAKASEGRYRAFIFLL